MRWWRRLILMLVLAGGAGAGAAAVIWPDKARIAARNLVAPPGGRPKPLDPAYEARLDAFLDKSGIDRLSAADIAVLGHGNGSLFSPAYGLNDFPPPALWPNVVPTLKVLDAFQGRCGCTVQVLSSYRTPAYNGALRSAAKSQHLRFVAIDFRASAGTPEEWRRILREMRAAGVFKGGIGLYGHFVHVDTRGWNADW